MEFVHDLNPLIIFITAMSTYVVAGIWYSPGLFGKTWHRESRDTVPFSATHPFRVLAIGFALALIPVITLSLVLGPHPTIVRATGLGFDIGFCFVATSFGIHYQFANLSLKLWLIDGGFRVVQFAVFGWLLGWLGRFG